ncbi:Mfs monocarboxylate [Neofusicoccum parvum]|uniref:Mfs monocarboxylate n=1 Tax=Neofusicoccum parvum TaxID=310453 RepID=A0ACB5RQ99_9PEZI|nr:Mfs monocarboxylate [Neofusicoccum parvum]
MNRPLETFETEIEQETPYQTDGGKEAWLVLAANCLMQAPVWGFALAFGVIQEYYESMESGLVGNKSSVTIIGTTTTGILYLTSPLTFTLLTLHPSLRRWCGPLGLLITSGSFLASAFASHVWQLIALQGVSAALGGGLLYAPATLCLDERFARRKGLAYGIMGAAKSGVGVGLPFAASAALQRFGYRATIVGWAVAVTSLAAPLLFVLRPRIPSTAAGAGSTRSSSNRGGPQQQQRDRSVGRLATSPPSPSTSCLRSASFWALQTGNVLQSMGYFLPAAYLPGYATRELALPRATGTLLLALLNAASVFGSVLIGVLCDRVRSTRTVLPVTALPSAAAVLLFWGLAGPRGRNRQQSSSAVLSSSTDNTDGGSTSTGSSSGVALLVVFALAYGFFAGGFSSTWSGVLRELQRENPALDTGLVFGLLNGGRGVGNVVSGPISVALMAARQHGHDRGKAAAATMGSSGESGGGGRGAGGAYGSEYGPMILFTGASALLGAWGWLCQCQCQCRSSPWPSSWWQQRRAALLLLAVPAPPHWRARWSRSCLGGCARRVVAAAAGAWHRRRRRASPAAPARPAAAPRTDQ